MDNGRRPVVVVEPQWVSLQVQLRETVPSVIRIADCPKPVLAHTQFLPQGTRSYT